MFLQDSQLFLTSYWKAIKLMIHPQVRRYSLLPILIGMVISVIASYGIWQWSLSAIGLDYKIPTESFFQFLNPLLSVIESALSVLLMSVILLLSSVTLMATMLLIMSFWYDKLTLAVLKLCHGVTTEHSLSLPKQIIRELKKLGHLVKCVLKGLLASFIIGLIPGLQFLAPLVLSYFTAMGLAIECTDYTGEALGLTFDETLNAVKTERSIVLGIGLMALLTSPIPILNLACLPIHIAAAAIMAHRTFATNIK